MLRIVTDLRIDTGVLDGMHHLYPKNSECEGLLSRK